MEKKLKVRDGIAVVIPVGGNLVWASTRLMAWVILFY